MKTRYHRNSRFTVISLLLLFCLGLPVQAQNDDVTFTEKFDVFGSSFAFDGAVGNQQAFVSGADFLGNPVLLHYSLNPNGTTKLENTLTLTNNPVKLAATDNLLFASAFNSTLTVLDISDPDNPTEKGTAATSASIFAMVAHEHLAFVSFDGFSNNTDIEIFDASDPDNPTKVGQYTPGAFAGGLFLLPSGTELLVATEEKLEIVDVSDPTNPTLLGSVDLAARGQYMAVIGTTAFVGSQNPEFGFIIPGWVLEAIDISDLTNPQVLGSTSDTVGPIQGVTALGDAFILASTQAGLQAFSFDETTAAFKRDGSFTPRGSTSSTASTFISLGDPSTFAELTPDCLPFMALQFIGFFQYGALGSGSGPPKTFEIKIPGVASLTTGYSATPVVQCPVQKSGVQSLGGGTLKADGGEWNVSALTFSVVSANQAASLRTEFIDRIELTIAGVKVIGTLVHTSRQETNPVTGETASFDYVTEIEFTGLNIQIGAGETKTYTLELFPHSPILEGDNPMCSILGPVKQHLAQLSIHGVNQVTATGPEGGVQLPNADVVGGVIDQACVINVTPDPDVGFGFIQAGIDGSVAQDRIGVCLGAYLENPTFGIDQKERTLFSFNGPEETEILAFNTAAPTVTIAGDKTVLQGFIISFGTSGVEITGDADEVLIGPPTLAEASPKQAEIPELSLCQSCNVIQSNRGAGITVAGKQATIQGNFIGTTVDGDDDQPNDVGIRIIGLKTGNERTGAEKTFIRSNLISGNDDTGVRDSGLDSRYFQNIVGLDRTGRELLPNEVGIELDFDNESAELFDNVISGNTLSGVVDLGTGAVYRGNIIGLDRVGVNDVGNGAHGIEARGKNTFIQGKAPGQNPNENIISGNGDFGIFVQADNTHIQHNIIGLTKAGFSPRGNDKGGIFIAAEATETLIGEDKEAGNVISANGGPGIDIQAGSKQVTIQGNIIGLNTLGTDFAEKDSGNADGIVVQPLALISSKTDPVTNLLIGGPDVGQGNVISGNKGDGIQIRAPLINAKIQRNIIGLDETLQNTRSNKGDGIDILPPPNEADIQPQGNLLIGGELRIDLIPKRNIISGNEGSGINFSAMLQPTQVCGNIIGMGFNINADLVGKGNQGVGLSIIFPGSTIAPQDTPELLIGSRTLERFSDPCDINAISGNGDSGMLIHQARNVRIKNNVVGDDDPVTQIAFPNGDDGIDIRNSRDITIANTLITGHRNTNGTPEAAGIVINNSRDITLQENEFVNNQVAVFALQSALDVTGNTFKKNDTCAFISKSIGTGVGVDFLFSGNFLVDCEGASTGLHLTDVENALVAGNQFVNNAGAAIRVEGTSNNIQVQRNNFQDNPQFALENRTQQTINAQNNFWGSSDGPSGQGQGQGDAVSGPVDFDNFLTQQVSVVIAAPDSARIPIATPDTASVFFQNFADLEGTLAVTVSDEQGWLTGAGKTEFSFEVSLSDSAGASGRFPILIPEGTAEDIANRVTVKAVSTIDLAQSDSVTFVLIADDPATNTAIEAPGEEIGAGEATEEVPEGFVLSAAYPNPFNPEAQFTLKLARTQAVEVAVFDVLGRRMAVLHRGLLLGDQVHRFVIRATDWPSGLYYYRVVGEGLQATRKVMLVK